jgi:hypothetical protein
LLADRNCCTYPFATIRDPPEPHMKKITRTYRSMLVILPIFALLALFPDSGPILPVMGLAAIVVILFNFLES